MSGTLHYEEFGDGRPIVFLHGWTMDHRVEMADYEKIFAARRGWRRIYPDLPGMGRSAAGDGITTQDDVLEAVLAFIDRVVPHERFVLAGTSLGAYLARAVVARRRSRIAGLLLRVPCIVADTAQRTLPPFRPLVRDAGWWRRWPARNGRAWATSWCRHRHTSTGCGRRSLR